MERCVIMPLFSLCGDRGSLGECAYNFVDKTAKRGVRYWLMPSFGDNYVGAIDLELLRMDGLVTVAEIRTAAKNKAKRDDILCKAFSRFWKPESYAEFEKAHSGEYKDEYEMFLRYEFAMQYDALISYALSRGVNIVSSLPQGVETVYFK